MSRRIWSELRAEQIATPEARQAYAAAARTFRLGEEVRSLRMERRLSQKELAERMGLPQSVIARLEAGGVEVEVQFLAVPAREESFS